MIEFVVVLIEVCLNPIQSACSTDECHCQFQYQKEKESHEEISSHAPH